YYQVSTRRVIESTYNYILIAGAAMMSWVLSYYQALDPGVNYLIENDFSPTVFLLILMLIYVVLGTFMEPNSAMLIIVPLSVPIIQGDRKSTRLNSSHVSISYAVFCLKKK